MRSMPSTIYQVTLAVLFLACLLASAEAITYDSLKIFSWNMGSDYCRYGNCHSYVKEAVDKVISLGDQYDILCLQEFPKFDKFQQSAAADKLINDFVLKYKYSIFRKEGTNLAILSKFPIQDMGEINLSNQYGAQRVIFMAGSKKIQVVNIHNIMQDFVPELEDRKEDIRKVLQWMNSSENAGDANILAGVFNMQYADVDEAIKDVKPFGQDGIPPRSCPGPIFCIYAWGEMEWPFDMETLSDQNIQQAIIYTKSFGAKYQYVPNRAVVLKNQDSFLVVNGTVNGTESQWAVFGSPTYLSGRPRIPYKFIVEQPVNGGGVRIISPFDGVSYLSLNSQLRLVISYTRAFWGSWKYLQELNFVKDPRFIYNPTIQTLSSFGEQACYLSPNNKVLSNSDWEVALFGTDSFISLLKRSKIITMQDL